MKRPDVCHEQNCKCIFTGYRKLPDMKDYSFFCVGKMKTPITLYSNTVEHANDHYLCIWTPFRGWVKLQVNDNDMFWIKLIYQQYIKYKEEHDDKKKQKIRKPVEG